MNRSIISAVLSVAMVILMSSAAHALLAPHVYTCDNCHAMQQSATILGTVDACLTCHNPTGSAAHMPFESGDMSNRFNSVPNMAKGTQSSHNWDAVLPFDQRAVVQEPLNGNLYIGYNNVSLAGTVSCERCHNVKSASNSTPGVDKPFLRIPNNTDQLCLDCHRDRNKPNSQTGTHPVAYRAYSTVYKGNTSAFRKVPATANPSNYTSKIGNYLKSGLIVCSTCHAPHYADSSSATFDNRSTAAGYLNYTAANKKVMNQFAKSSGDLLRTDMYGKNATDVNICSSCHKETAQLPHNKLGQGVQCLHCHGGHVDNALDGLAPNRFLIERFINVSTPFGKVVNKKVVFNSATSLKFKAADGTGICQACHAVPTGTNWPSQHAVVNAKDTTCTGCHSHNNGFSAGNCTNCHGQPPVSLATTAPGGYTRNEANNPHATHAGKGLNYSFQCRECHYDGISGSNHAQGSFQDVFVDTTGSIGEAVGRKNTTADYNTTSYTCSNVYCHSNGNPRGGTPVYTPVVWDNGKGSIVGTPGECSACHGFGATLTSNAHDRHVIDGGYNCDTCHNSTVDATNKISTTGLLLHANGAKDVALKAGGVYTSSTATCTNNCHTNTGGTTPIRAAVWTDTVTGAAYCGSCHASAPSSGAHNTHFSAVQGPNLGTNESICNTCHTYTGPLSATHPNGLPISMKATPCAPCHPNTVPVWTDPALNTCQSCHMGIASVVNGFTAPLKDNTLYNASTHAYSCGLCHDGAAPHIGAGPDQKRLKSPVNTLCNQCHVTGSISNPNRTDLLTHTAFTHYTTTVANKCSACHEVHGTTNLNQIRTVINGVAITFTNLSTGFIKSTAPYDGFCQVCHTRTSVYKKGQAVAGNGHDQRNCLNCHMHKVYPNYAATFAFQGIGGCTACHGYPPVQNTTGMKVLGNYTGAKLENYSGGGGAHSVAGHLVPTISPTLQFAGCNNCHYNTSPNGTHNQGGTAPFKPSKVNVTVDPKYKFNSAQPITYSGTMIDPPARNTTGTCSNVSCHFQPSPKWSTER
jgi:predicted CxxxxCH...CXXCH cytochrome family protein